jgi:hypothetical protein
MISPKQFSKSFPENGSIFNNFVQECCVPKHFISGTVCPRDLSVQNFGDEKSFGCFTRIAFKLGLFNICLMCRLAYM